jgi:epoxyqueuosine reductase
LNECEAPFPAWVEPSWHAWAIGCLRCQQVCPENATVELLVEPPERFDEAESAAILAGDQIRLGAATRTKLARCGLDYSASLIARNIRALL